MGQNYQWFYHTKKWLYPICFSTETNVFKIIILHECRIFYFDNIVWHDIQLLQENKMYIGLRSLNISFCHAIKPAYILFWKRLRLAGISEASWSG